MRRHHPENEAVKREYFAFLRNAKGRDDATIDLAAAAIHGFEAFNRYASFKTFHRKQVISFKTWLEDQTHPKTGKPLSRATLHSRLQALKAFFEWLSREHGYRQGVQYSDAAYFSLSANDARVATARREQTAPSLEQIIHVLQSMPGETLVQRRDRAVMAFIILTGARDGAVATMRLKHVNLAAGTVNQDAREVKTKRAKTFTSSFFPVGDFPRQIVADWINELKAGELFGPDDPIFPASDLKLDDAGLFHAAGLKRETWTSADPIRQIFRRAFVAAGVDYYPPHSFRRTIARLADDLNLTVRQMKAWSQSLGHSDVNTTLSSYAQLSANDQARVMAQLAEAGPKRTDGVSSLAVRIAALMEEEGSR